MNTPRSIYTNMNQVQISEMVAEPSVRMVYAAICALGAVSWERLEKMIGKSPSWALTVLECEESAGLYTLPDHLFPAE